MICINTFCNMGICLTTSRISIFDENEHGRGDVMRQRLNGNEYDGVRDLLDDLIHGDMPDLPPPWEKVREPEEPPEPKEPEPTAKAFYDMLAAAKKPLYEGAPIS
jgi:hypothetical protein